MSEDDQRQDQNQGTDGGVGSQRAASVRLREAESSEVQRLYSRMDPANESLADALRITFFVVKLAMFVLAFLFVFSGFRSINEGQRGIKVRFGKQVDAQIEPGFAFTAPFPIGELISVDKGTVEASITRDFIPYVQEGQELNLDRLSSRRDLDPTRDGSNITADLNLAHTQWTINFRRDDHALWAQNVLPTQETELVKAAVRRGVVRAIAQVSIDELLKDSGQLGSRVREIAQRTLDDMDTGIRIEQVILRAKIPPVSLEDKFAQVNNAAQNAGQARDNARLQAASELNAVAGEAAPVLIEQIDRYEEAVELGRQDEADQVLAIIDALLEGESVEIDGTMHGQLVSGEVSEILREADELRFQMVSRARADLEFFRAKELQFEANPRLMITQEWTSAFAQFIDSPLVEVMMIPEGVSGEIRINSDKDLINELIEARNRRQSERAAEERERLRALDRYRSQRGIINDDEM